MTAKKIVGQKTKKEPKMKIRHGDVILELISEIPAEAELLKGRKELAFGEVTGHAHRVDIVDAIFETKDGQLYLKASKLTTLTHEEHKGVQLKPGCYRVSIKRQYTPDGGWERVAD